MTRPGPRTAADDDLARILPEGVGPPDDVPGDVFECALNMFLAPRRVDMRALALELGMGRSSLYRKVRSRDHLLGAVLWYLAKRSLVRALQQVPPEAVGTRRVLAVIRSYLHQINRRSGLRRFLQEEPEAALRILTSKAGGVQRAMIDTVERLLVSEEAVAGGHMHLDRANLAYVIVRIAESFLYADVIADNEPDVDRAIEVIARLLGHDWEI
jgi:AcrR family transcriptional regulator